MRGLRATTGRLGVFALILGAPLAGCGGTRQDAHEPDGNFPVAIDSATFPAAQHLSQAAKLSIVVRNTGSAAIPNVAVTVNGFDYSSTEPGLANRKRPVWIVDEQPSAGQTAYANTWALGRVAAGESRTFAWTLTPVRSGRFHVDYRVAAGLNGRAKAQLAGGGVPQGSFDVAISGAPTQASVNPDSGAVNPGPPPGAGPAAKRGR